MFPHSGSSSKAVWDIRPVHSAGGCAKGKVSVGYRAGYAEGSSRDVAASRRLFAIVPCLYVGVVVTLQQNTAFESGENPRVKTAVVIIDEIHYSSPGVFSVSVAGGQPYAGLSSGSRHTSGGDCRYRGRNAYPAQSTWAGSATATVFLRGGLPACPPVPGLPGSIFSDLFVF